MPRLSRAERLEVTELIKNGSSQREVARRMKTSHSTIQRLIKKHEATGSIEDRPRSGRPRIPVRSESSWFECVGLKRSFVCTECGKTFQNYHGLKNHIKIHKEERQYQCDQCGRGFLNHSSLVRHLRIHTGEKPFICEYCARGFADMATMRTHIRTHTGERPHKCHLCDHACRSAGNLHSHMKVHRDKDGNVPRPINIQPTKSQAVPVFEGIEMLRRAKRTYDEGWIYESSENKSDEESNSCENDSQLVTNVKQEEDEILQRQEDKEVKLYYETMETANSDEVNEEANEKIVDNRDQTENIEERKEENDKYIYEHIIKKEPIYESE